MDDPKVYLVLIMIEDGGSLGQCSAIRHEGKLWLVPQWLDIPSEGMSMPERIICLDGLPTQPGWKIGDREFDLLLNYPVPTSVLYGPVPTQREGNFVVVERPDIKFRRLSVH